MSLNLTKQSDAPRLAGGVPAEKSQRSASKPMKRSLVCSLMLAVAFGWPAHLSRAAETAGTGQAGYYRPIVPAMGECENLLVPVCLSASHVAYGSIRMEPVFMILGQSAGTAASLAIDGKLAVQAVPYEDLRARLLKDAQRLE